MQSSLAVPLSWCEEFYYVSCCDQLGCQDDFYQMCSHRNHQNRKQICIFSLIYHQLLFGNQSLYRRKLLIVSPLYFIQWCKISLTNSPHHFLILKKRDWPFCSWQCPYFMSHYFMFCLGHLGTKWGSSACSSCDQGEKKCLSVNDAS